LRGVNEATHRRSRPGPPEQAAQRETLAAVARAVDALPAQQRAALILRKYQ
jgi:DNA-directed RNA polymerase specialized sigma24 family protein